MPDSPEGMAALTWTRLQQWPSFNLRTATPTPLDVVAALGPVRGRVSVRECHPSGELRLAQVPDADHDANPLAD